MKFLSCVLATAALTFLVLVSSPSGSSFGALALDATAAASNPLPAPQVAPQGPNQVGTGFPAGGGNSWNTPGQPSLKPSTTSVTTTTPGSSSGSFPTTNSAALPFQNEVLQLSDRFIQAYSPRSGANASLLFAPDARIVGPFSDWGILTGPRGFTEFQQRGMALFDVRQRVDCTTVRTDVLRSKSIIRCRFPGMTFLPTGQTQDLELTTMLTFDGQGLIRRMVSVFDGTGAEITKTRSQALFQRLMQAATHGDPSQFETRLWTGCKK